MTNRPSLTARIVALARAIGLPGLRDPVAREVLPWTDAVAARAITVVASGRLTRLGMRLATGGLVDHAALRMAAVDREVEDAVAAGCRQVVVLGAGLDTRAWRMQALDGVALWEVDLPAVQDIKRSRLSTGRAHAAQVRFVPVDLTNDDLAPALADAGHDPDVPTAWIWEAVAVYLPRRAVEETLQVVGSLSTPGSRLAMTFVTPDVLQAGPLQPIVDGLARGLFLALGEPMHTLLDPAEASTLVEAAGLDVRSISTWRDWARDADEAVPIDLFGSEQLLVAERS